LVDVVLANCGSRICKQLEENSVNDRAGKADLTEIVLCFKKSLSAAL
jgi:hypothetical protein